MFVSVRMGSFIARMLCVHCDICAGAACMQVDVSIATEANEVPIFNQPRLPHENFHPDFDTRWRNGDQCL
ncbi:hypothetical protein UNDYM_0547 [Undibacterium sp. YM2]|nr:hypothetical protein UNDYM_0547 [Undibacterium sp. YM2]